jgi:hypothetical protein
VSLQISVACSAALSDGHTESPTLTLSDGSVQPFIIFLDWLQKISANFLPQLLFSLVRFLGTTFAQTSFILSFSSKSTAQSVY